MPALPAGGGAGFAAASREKRAGCRRVAPDRAGRLGCKLAAAVRAPRRRRRTPSAPLVRRRTGREPARGRGDAAAAVRQAAARRDRAADRCNRTGGRLRQPASLQCRVRRGLGQAAAQPAPRAGRDLHAQTRISDCRSRRHHAAPAVSRAVRFRAPGRVLRAPLDSRRRDRRRGRLPAQLLPRWRGGLVRGRADRRRGRARFARAASEDRRARRDRRAGPAHVRCRCRPAGAQQRVCEAASCCSR